MSDNKYVIGLKRTGLKKPDMIDYIAGIFNNDASRYSCLKFVASYFDDKSITDIADETKLRRLLKNSPENVVRNIYELCIKEYKHLAQYRDDNMPNHPQGVARADGQRFANGDTVGRNFNKNFVTFEQFSLKEEKEISAAELDIDTTSALSNDIFNKLSDIENQIRIYVNDIDSNFMELSEGLKLCQRYIRRAMYNVNEKASFEQSVTLNEQNESPYSLQQNIINLIDCMDSSETKNPKINKCRSLMEKCLIILEKMEEQF